MTTPNTNDPLVSSAAAREQLGGISSATLWRWQKKGFVTLVCIRGRNYIRQSNIDAIKDAGDGNGVMTPPGTKRLKATSA